MAKMWAGRFQKEESKEVNDFNSSISFDDDGGAYNQADSAGFINLFGLPVKVQAMVNEKNKNLK